MEDRIYPAAVIGLGASGIAAAVYLSRMGVDPICFDPAEPGGQLLECGRVHSYPGFDGTGAELVKDMRRQLEENRIQHVRQAVTAMTRNPDGTLSLVAGGTLYRFYTVVIATGFTYTIPEIPGIEDVEDLVSSRPLTDADRVRGQTALIWGGGQRALAAASQLAEIATSTVFVCQNRDGLSARMLEDYQSRENAALIEGTILSVSREEKGLRATVRSADGTETSVAAQGLYVLLDHRYQRPQTGFVGLPEIRDDQGNIAVDRTGKTFVAGVYACGDVVQKSVRNLAVDASEGAMCGICAYRYYMDLKSEGKAR